MTANLNMSSEKSGENKRKSDECNADRPKRLRKEIERFGTSNVHNDDELFDEIDENNNSDASKDPDFDGNSEEVNEERDILENDATNSNGTTEEKEQENHAKSSEIDESSALEIMSPGERIIFKMALGISADIKTIKKSLIDLRSSNNTIQQSGPINKSVDKQQLLEIGLPLTSKNGFDEFEKKLKQEVFEKKVVCILYTFIHKYVLYISNNIDYAYIFFYSLRS